MNIGNRLAIIVTVLSVCIWGVCGLLLRSEDKIPPVITFTDNQTVYREGMDVKELLEGVSAKDSKDGDVTDQIVIEKITKTSNGKTVIVTYAAGDNARNYAKASRIFEAKETAGTARQSDSKSTLEAEEVAGKKPENSSLEIQPEDSAEQEQQEDEQEKEQQEEEEQNGEQQPVGNETAGQPQVQTAPVLRLNTAETTLKKGTFFNVNDYIALLSDDVDTTETLQHRIRTNGEFDNNQPGDYQVTIMVADSDGNVSQAQSMVIHVVE